MIGPESKNSRLTVEQAGYRVGESILLDAVDLRLEPGEMVVALGPNGAGKSSLLKLMSGELKPHSGTISLDHRAIHAVDPEQLAKRFAVLPQMTQLNFPFTAREVVSLGRIPHQTGLVRDHQVVDEMLEAFDIVSLAHRDYLTLSGGEQQRVQIARVCAQIAGIDENGFLLLDEPTAALDLSHQHAVLSHVRNISRQGIGVFAVLHDMNLAASYADRIVLLNQGRVVSQGPPSGVLTRSHLETVFGVNIRLIDHEGRSAPHIISW